MSGLVAGHGRNGQALFQAFTFDGTTTTTVPTPGGSNSRAWDINDAGQIAGWGRDTNNLIVGFRWDPVAGVVIVGNFVPGGDVFAVGINNSGHVAGAIQKDFGHQTPGRTAISRSFLWNGSTIIDIGLVPGFDGSAANLINDHGQIVGLAFNFDVNGNAINSTAFLYENGVNRNLNDLIPANSGWNLTNAYDINELGQIVGQGVFQGETRAFLLTPVSVPEPLSLILLGLALVGLWARRSPKASFASLVLACGSGGVARILSLLILFLVLGCVSSLAPTVEAIGYQFVTLDYPAPNHQTNAYSINDSGVVAGTWRDGSTTRGFVHNGTSFTPYSAPGNVSTFLRAVNNNGDLTGAFRVSATARDGFVQSGGTFASFNVPGAAFTLPYGITSSGAITGGYTQAGVAGSRGFLRVGSTLVTYTIPGAVDVFPYAINDLGFVAGAFTDGSGEVKSFLRRPDGAIEVLDIAGADELTVFGINNAGVLVGAANEDDGVIWDGSELQLLRFPGSTRTTITDINNHGQFVGIYQDSNGVTHSFSARAVPEPANVILLGLGLVGCAQFIRRNARRLTKS